MAWKDAQVEYDAAQREVSHWAQRVKELNDDLLEAEKMCSKAIERRDAAEKRFEKQHQQR